MEVYAGRLQEEVKLREEKHPLVFLELEKEDFFSLERFAGEGNIGPVSYTHLTLPTTAIV